MSIRGFYKKKCFISLVMEERGMKQCNVYHEKNTDEFKTLLV